MSSELSSQTVLEVQLGTHPTLSAGLSQGIGTAIHGVLVPGHRSSYADYLPVIKRSVVTHTISVHSLGNGVCRVKISPGISDQAIKHSCLALQNQLGLIGVRDITNEGLSPTPSLSSASSPQVAR